eukprot:4376544-Pleurochrysis_carterae.AAC.1
MHWDLDTIQDNSIQFKVHTALARSRTPFCETGAYQASDAAATARIHAKLGVTYNVDVNSAVRSQFPASSAPTNYRLPKENLIILAKIVTSCKRIIAHQHFHTPAAPRCVETYVSYESKERHASQAFFCAHNYAHGPLARMGVCLTASLLRSC